MTKQDIFSCGKKKTMIILEDDWEAQGKGVFRLISKVRPSKILD